MFLQMSPPCESNWLYNKRGNSKFSGPESTSLLKNVAQVFWRTFGRVVVGFTYAHK